MRCRKLAATAATVVVVVATISFGAAAATGPRMGPQKSWDDMQKFEYYIGQAGSALNMCNHYGLANSLKELADLSPYGRKGWQSLLSFDDIRGAQCGRIAEDAKNILLDRDKLWDYLTVKYNCPDGKCPAD